MILLDGGDGYSGGGAVLNSNRCWGQTGYAGGSNGGNGEREGGNGSGVDIGTFTFINDPMTQWNVFDLTPGEGGEAGG